MRDDLGRIEVHCRSLLARLAGNGARRMRDKYILRHSRTARFICGPHSIRFATRSQKAMWTSFHRGSHHSKFRRRGLQSSPGLAPWLLSCLGEGGRRRMEWLGRRKILPATRKVLEDPRQGLHKNCRKPVNEPRRQAFWGALPRRLWRSVAAVGFVLGTFVGFSAVRAKGRKAAIDRQACKNDPARFPFPGCFASGDCLGLGVRERGGKIVDIKDLTKKDISWSLASARPTFPGSTQPPTLGIRGRSTKIDSNRGAVQGTGAKLG